MQLNRRFLILLLGLSPCLVLVGCRESPWETLLPRYSSEAAPTVYKFTPSLHELKSVWTRDGKDLWAVGAHGLIVESDNGGDAWIPRSSGTTNDLCSIIGTIDGAQLWVVGAHGTILRSRDGKIWSTRESSTTQNLASIFGTPDGEHLWAVGEHGVILHSDGGQRWSSVNSNTLDGLTFITGSADGRHLWAVGKHGTIVQWDEDGPWNLRNSGTKNDLFSLFRPSNGSRVWAVGAATTIVESDDDGAHWSAHSLGMANRFSSISGTDDGKRLWVTSEDAILELIDHGKRLHLRAGGVSSNSLNFIFTISGGGHLWAVGERGRILDSNDGTHWKDRPIDPSQAAMLTSVVGSRRGNQLWAVGSDGMILESDDGGDFWSPRDSGTRKVLKSIFRTENGKLWAVGTNGTILESDDGVHWNPHPSKDGYPFFSIFGTPDGKRLWAVGSNIVESSDGGEHWESRSGRGRADFASIFGTADGKRLWTVGNGGTILESADGKQWNLRSIGTTVNLSSTFSTADGNKVWVVGEHGTILRSEDGGGHWEPRASGTTNNLFFISGLDDGRHLWAVGEKGTILESYDEGERWNPLASGTISNLYSILVSSDGARLWATGDWGTILHIDAAGTAPILSEAHLSREISGNFLQLRTEQNGSVWPPTGVSAQGRNDYDSRHNIDWQQESKCNPQKQENDVTLWNCTFDPERLSLQFDHKVHFLIHLQREGGTDIYEFTTIYDPWAFFRKHPDWVSFVAAIFVLTVLPTVLLFTRPLWNLRMYHFLRLSRIDKIDLPLFGDASRIVLRLVTVLPFFVRHARTLDAWFEKNRHEIRKAWEAELGFSTDADSSANSFRSPSIYVPLPTWIGNPVSGVLVEQPNAEEMRKLLDPERSIIQIVGPGGAGKTTLARQIAEWSFQNGPGSGLSDHPMLPVWVDEELDSEKKPLPAVVRGKLLGVLLDDELEDELFTALLRKQRLLVIVDRVSERPLATRHYIETIFRSARIGSLILTSRTLLAIEGAQSVCIYPQPLNSGTLFRFMTNLLPVFLPEIGEDPRAPSRPFSTLQEQVKLAERLASIIRLRTEVGEEDVPLVPLTVRLFVEQAVQLLKQGNTLEDLPHSLPSVYFRYLRQVNPANPSVEHFLDGDKMINIAKVLGRTALGRDFIPKEFSSEAARAALKAAGEEVLPSCDPLARLRMNGVLVEKPYDIDTRFRFALDPVAEFLAAAAYAEQCGPDADAWRSALSDSAHAGGFQTALRLTWQTYGRDRGWADLLHLGANTAQ